MTPSVHNSPPVCVPCLISSQLQAETWLPAMPAELLAPTEVRVGERLLRNTGKSRTASSSGQVALGAEALVLVTLLGSVSSLLGGRGLCGRGLFCRARWCLWGRASRGVCYPAGSLSCVSLASFDPRSFSRANRKRTTWWRS